jgi:hypothetical protein
MATNIKAEVIYYTQFIGRDDIPSLGLSQLVRHNIWNSIGLPEDRRISVLSPRSGTAPRTLVEETGTVQEVTIMCIVRTNYAELKQALVNFTSTYPLTLRASGGPVLRIRLTEHLPQMSLPETWKRYAQADIVLGPHGAGTSHLDHLPSWSPRALSIRHAQAS